MCILDFNFVPKLYNRCNLGTYLYRVSMQLGPSLVYWNEDMDDLSVEIVYLKLI